MFKFLFRNKLKVIFSLLGISSIAACYSTLQPGKHERRDFTVCLTLEDVAENCKKPIRVSVLKQGELGSVKPDYLTASKAELTLKLPRNEKMTSYIDDSASYVLVDFWLESFHARYERHFVTDPTGSGLGYAIHRQEGNLIALKETDQKEEGLEYFVPANGDKSIFIRCLKKYRATAGNLVTNPGCHVFTQIQPYVFIQYAIQRQYLQDWQSINEDILKKTRAVMKIN